MNLQRVTIRNFRSIRSHTYTFDHTGLCGIMGRNGSGKSSLLFSVTYALFGRISKDVKVGEVINWDAKKDLLVKLDFTSAGHEYSIIRTVDTPEYGTDLLVFKDNVRIKGANKIETQQILETEIIGMNFDTFCSSVYFNIQSAAGSILYATDANRRKSFNEITGLDYYDKFFAKVKDRLKDVKLEVQTARIRLEEINKSLSSDGTVALADKVKSWELERKTKVEDLNAKHSKFSVENASKVLEADKKMDQLRTAIVDLERLMEVESKAAEDLADLNAQASILNDEITTYYKKLPELKVLDSKIESLIQELKILNDKAAQAESKIGENCEACGQLLTKEGLPHLKSYFSSKLDLVKHQGAPLFNKAQELKSSILSEADIKSKEIEAAALKAKINSIKSSSKSSILKTSIESNRNTLNNLIQTKADLKNKQSPYKGEIELLQSQSNPYVELLDQQRKQYQILTDRKKAASDLVEKLVDDMESWEILKDYEKELKLVLVRDTVISVNHYLASFLDVLGDGELRCEFIFNEGTNINIDISVRGNSTSFFSLSLGQQASMRFCTQLAFFRHVQESLGLEFPFLFLDEGLDGMDDINKVKAADLIRTTFSQLDCVYIIDHDKSFLSKLDTYIEVESEDGTSRFL